jgi:hypothetical protein
MFFFEKNNNLPDRHPQAVYNDSDIILGLSYGIYSGGTEHIIMETNGSYFFIGL